MQFIAGTIEDSSEGIVRISIQKPLVYRNGEKATLLYLNGGNLRVVGSIKLCAHCTTKNIGNSIPRL